MGPENPAHSRACCARLRMRTSDRAISEENIRATQSFFYNAAVALDLLDRSSTMKTTKSLIPNKEVYSTSKQVSVTVGMHYVLIELKFIQVCFVLVALQVQY